MMFLTYMTIGFYLLSTAAYLSYLFFQKNKLHRSGYWLLVGGFASNTLALLLGAIRTGHLPLGNMHDTLSIAAWAVAGAFLLFHFKYRLKVLGTYVAPLCTATMIAASRLPQASGESQAIFKSFWLTLHIVTVFLGDAALALACGIGLLYLLQENAIKRKRPGFFFKRLPSLELLDTAGYACVVSGFTLLTFGLITGFVYAKAIWGHFWSWDPKEVWSGVAWLLYAALLHGRLTVGWRGRKAAFMAMIGFGVLLFTFFGVNLLFKGHHGDFTRL